MEYEIVTVEEKSVCGISIRTENAGNKAVGEIGDLWGGFFGENVQGQIKGRVDAKYIGLYTEYEKDHTKPYTYLAGCAVEAGQNEEQEVKTIRAGRYAKFTARGDVQQEVGRIWNAVWNASFKRSYQSDFEEYTYGSDPMHPQEIDIYIGIEEE